MDLNIVRTEIESDPAQRGYAGKDAEALADLMNAKYRTAYGDVAIGEVLIWAAGAGAFSKLRAIATDSPLYDAAQAFLIMLQSGGVQALHLGHPDVQWMAQSFVVAGVFTQAQHDALLAKGAIALSRADELGLERVWAGHISEALA